MILDEIIEKRKVQLSAEKERFPLPVLRRAAGERQDSTRGFAAALRGGSLRVIAEVKKASPSRGLICPDFHPALIASAYEKAGANAISVLTEEAYFKGSNTFLEEVRAAVSLPLLRKDFIIDPYQIYHARVLGADAVLLIAALLEDDRLEEFTSLAHSLSLDCLTEVHTEEELCRAVSAGSDLIGINNRNLKTFEVTLETTRRLAPLVPEGRTIVAESGVKDNADMKLVRSCGAHAVLIGETLMRSKDIAATLTALRRDV